MESLSWRAKEFEQPERNPNWFLSLWILAAAFIVVAIILKNYLFAFFIFLSAGIINIYALRVPQVVDFEITEEYIKVAQKKHILENFDSFWIFERNTGNILSLEAKKGIRTNLEIPLVDADIEKVRSILSQTLEEKEHKESLIDALSDWLKF